MTASRAFTLIYQTLKSHKKATGIKFSFRIIYMEASNKIAVRVYMKSGHFELIEFPRLHKWLETKFVIVFNDSLEDLEL